MAYPLKQHSGGFVVRILGNELAFEGALENRSSKTFSSLQVYAHSVFQLFHHRETPFNIRDDPPLLCQRRQRDSDLPDTLLPDVSHGLLIARS